MTKDENVIIQYYKNIIGLGANLFNEFQRKNVSVKIIDRSSSYYGIFLRGLEDDSTPPECSVYISHWDPQARLLVDRTFRDNHPNIVLKPYSPSLQHIRADNVFFLLTRLEEDRDIETEEDMGDTFSFDEHFFTYLCNQGFGQVLARYSDATKKFFSNRIGRLQQYLSPFAVIPSGETFLDCVFSQVKRLCYSVEYDNNTFADSIKENKKFMTELFIPLVRQYGIDINTYIYHRKETFLMNLFSDYHRTTTTVVRDDLSNAVFHPTMFLIKTLMSQGVNPFFEVDGKTILETFFSKMTTLTEDNEGDQFEIFNYFLKYQTVTDKKDDLFSLVSDQGNTILHSFFKYASNSATMDILNTIMDAENLNINAVNADKETTFECFLSFNRFAQSQKFVMAVVDKFINRGFDFSLTTKDGKPLWMSEYISNKVPPFGNNWIDWEKIRLTVPVKRKRW